MRGRESNSLELQTERDVSGAGRTLLVVRQRNATQTGSVGRGGGTEVTGSGNQHVKRCLASGRADSRHLSQVVVTRWPPEASDSRFVSRATVTERMRFPNSSRKFPRSATAWLELGPARAMARPRILGTWLASLDSYRLGGGGWVTGTDGSGKRTALPFQKASLRR